MEDMAGNSPGRYYSPRHRIPCNSRKEVSKCVSMTWRAMSARPYRRPLATTHGGRYVRRPLLESAQPSVQPLQASQQRRLLHTPPRAVVPRGALVAGPHTHYSPRHPTHFEHSFLDSTNASLSQMASHDVASNICQAIPRGCHPNSVHRRCRPHSHTPRAPSPENTPHPPPPRRRHAPRSPPPPPRAWQILLATS